MTESHFQDNFTHRKPSGGLLLETNSHSHRVYFFILYFKSLICPLCGAKTIGISNES